MEIITPNDLASYLRESELDPSADLLVDLANGIVSDVTGDLVAPYPSRVRAITLEVAARAYRNPQGASSETIDDYTFRRDGDTAAGGVYLTRAERSELSGAVGFTAGAYTVGVVSPLDVP